eukprot:1186981-Prorocentrum_minimum.AAC.6
MSYISYEITLPAWRSTRFGRSTTATRYRWCASLRRTAKRVLMALAPPGPPAAAPAVGMVSTGYPPLWNASGTRRLKTSEGYGWAG